MLAVKGFEKIMKINKTEDIEKKGPLYAATLQNCIQVRFEKRKKILYSLPGFIVWDKMASTEMG